MGTHLLWTRSRTEVKEKWDDPAVFRSGSLVAGLSLGALDVTSWWFDPRHGAAYRIHQGVGTGIQFFTPPTSGRGNDWILVLDDASRSFPRPGASDRR